MASTSYSPEIKIVQGYRTDFQITGPLFKKMTNPLIERYFNIYRYVNSFVALSTFDPQ